MDFEVITKEADFWNLKEAWNSLNQESDYRKFMLSHEWFWAWWEAFGSTGSLWITLAKENGKIVGIVPFMKTVIFKFGIPLRTIQFMANAHSDETGFLVSGNKSKFYLNLIGFLFERRSEFDFLNFMLLPEEDNFVKMIKTQKDLNHFCWGIRPGVASPVLQLSSEFDEYLAGLSKKSRYNVRKKRREIERIPGFEIKSLVGESNVEKFLECVSRIEQHSWKFNEGKSLLSKKNVWKFYNSIIQIAAQNESFHGFVLFLENKPVAHEIVFAIEQEVFSLKISYDARWAKYSPGFVLKTDVIRWACENGYRTNHLLGDIEPWKLQLGGTLNPHVYVQAYRPGLHRTLFAKWEFDWVHKLGSAKHSLLKVGRFS